MSLSTILNNVNTSANNNSTQVVKKTSTSAANNSASSAAETASTETGFAQMFSQAVSAVPSKTLSPEVLAATTPTGTIQTSTYVFDPLGVVGQVPESNTFLQAIRAMLGKPLIDTSTSTAAPAPTPAPTAQVPTPPSQTPTAFAATATVAAQPSVSDALSAIEAQLSYQNTSPTTTTSIAPITTASALVDQYIANASAAAVASMQSTLADSVTQDKQAA